VDGVASGVWHWQGPHPGYDEPHIVSSYAVDDGDRLLLFDPIAPPDGLMTRMDTRHRAVVLTNPWHERETRALASDLVLWIASRQSVVVGDTLVDFGGGLEIHEPWLRTTTREQVIKRLRPLLELPVEHVLATHGGPHSRAALERAIA
jgi:hypothetical protein